MLVMQPPGYITIAIVLYLIKKHSPKLLWFFTFFINS